MKIVVDGLDSGSGRGSQRSSVWSRAAGSLYGICDLYAGYKAASLVMVVSTGRKRVAKWDGQMWGDTWWGYSK